MPLNESSPVLHESMAYAKGSVTFSIENTLFQLPKALLQRHSEAFDSMISDSEDTEKAISLDDTLNSFTLLYDVLISPFSSCLTYGHPTNTTENLLDLAVIANKYCAPSIEDLALEQLIPVSEVLDTASTMIRVIDVSLRVRFEALGSAPRADLMKLIFSGRLEKADCLLALDVAKRHGDMALRGASYYAIALHGDAWWKKNSSSYNSPRCDCTLDSSDRARLAAGTAACAQSWHHQLAHLSCDFLFPDEEDYHFCPQVIPLLYHSAKKQSIGRVEWFDVLGKLNATLAALEDDIPAEACTVFVDKDWCRGIVQTHLEAAIENAKSAITTRLFQHEMVF